MNKIKVPIAAMALLSLSVAFATDEATDTYPNKRNNASHEYAVCSAYYYIILATLAKDGETELAKKMRSLLELR